MKKKGLKGLKYLSILIIAFVVTLIGQVDRVFALPDKIGPIIQPGSHVMDHCSDDPEVSCYGLALKAYVENGENVPVICTDYSKDSPAEGSAICTLTNDWSNSVRYAVGELITAATATDGWNVTSTNVPYFAAEMALNRFLYDIRDDFAGQDIGGRNITATSLSSTYRTLFNTYLETAEAAYEEYRELTSSTTIGLSTNSLRFTESGDNYVSNTVTIDRFGVNYDITSNIGEVKLMGRMFSITIPKSEVSQDTKVNVSIKATRQFYYARRYSCGTYQSVTTVLLDSSNVEKRASISGVIDYETPKGKLTIYKIDSETRDELSGATITVTGPNNFSETFVTNGKAYTLEGLEYGTYTVKESKAPSGYTVDVNSSKTVEIGASNPSQTVTFENDKTKVIISKKKLTGEEELPGATLEIQNAVGTTVKYCGANNNTACRWVSTDKPYEIKGLPTGTYYLVETIAPPGYALNTQRVKFTIATDGTVTVDGAKSSDGKVTMKNELIKVKISKVDVTGQKELPGATLEIQDKNGNIVKYCKDAEGNNNAECKWVSTDKPYEIEGLPAGTYYLVETIAPKGYVLSKERKEFTVKADGKVNEVQMENQLTKVKISKWDVTGKKELPGATLEIQDEEGNIIKYCKDEEGNTNAECKWVSTDKPYEIEGLPVGVYYLIETTAPEGYVLNTEKIRFEVKEGEILTEVGMTNELEVDVPDTLSSRSALLLAIAMFDIALGIGIVTYVKKNKIEE